MADFRIFPSLIPDESTYPTQELIDDVNARVLQGIATALETGEINGQSSAWQIADYLSGNHYKGEIDDMRATIQEADPPYAEVDLSKCINDRGDITQYQ